MEQVDTCCICGKPDSVGNLSLWLVNSERRTVHVACWIEAHERATRDENTAA